MTTCGMARKSLAAHLAHLRPALVIHALVSYTSMTGKQEELMERGANVWKVERINHGAGLACLIARLLGKVTRLGRAVRGSSIRKRGHLQLRHC